MSKLRILLVDDHALVRRGLKALLENYDDVEIVGEAADGVEALEKAKNLKPDVILMDVHMPRMDGIEATRNLREQMPETSVVMLTVSDDDQDLFEALRSGAQGYVLKAVEPEQLISMLRGLRRGETPISPSLTRRIISSYTSRAVNRTGLVEELTPREREILAMVAQGATNKEVARALFISENTVKNHLRNIMGKLHAKNRAQAVVSALELGLIDAEKSQEPE